MKKFLLKLIALIKGRSLKQIKKSDLDAFIEAFEKTRDHSVASKDAEKEKAKIIAQKRDFQSF